MEVLKNIGFDWQVAIANFVNFMLIFFILKKFVFGPIAEVIAKRNKEIEEGVNNAKNSENELLLAKEKAEKSLKEARGEANKIIAKAKENGEKIFKQLELNAEKKSEEIISKAHVDIEKHKEQMEKEVFEKTAGLVALGVQKILGEDVDTEKNKFINKRALEVLKKS